MIKKFIHLLVAGLALTTSSFAQTADNPMPQESRVSLGGYGEMLYDSDRTGDTLDLYRVILYVGYQFDQEWSFNSELEIEHQNEIAMEQAFLQYESAGNWGARFGHLLVPMGLINEFHEPTTFWSANRPQTERLILPSTWHENGLGAYGQIGDFDFRAYLLTGFDAAGFDLANNGMRGGRQSGSRAAADNMALTGRIDYRGISGMNLGTSFWSGDSGQAGTGPGASDDGFATTLWDLHFQYDKGPLRLRGLYATAEIEDADLLVNASASDALEGWYLEAGWDVFAQSSNCAASLTPFLRYEEIDLQADSAADTLEQRKTIGLAFQPQPQVIFKLDLTNVEDVTGEQNIVQAAIGYVF